jgi:AraC-like DNA-binding protein
MLPFVKPSFRHVGTPPAEAWRCERLVVPAFEFSWHYHPEYELTLIASGTGQRFIGDSIEPFASGDLALIGPDLPHTYDSDRSASSAQSHEAFVVTFRPDFLGCEFLALTEFAPISALLASSAHGLAYSVDRDPLIDSLICAMPDLPPAERTLALLQVLLKLARCGAGRQLSAGAVYPPSSAIQQNRIDVICRHLAATYTQPVRLDRIAAVAHMVPVACSRFFRQRMGRTITAYVNELRLAAACRMLIETDLPIAEVASEAGYQNLSHFNRQFLAAKAETPRSYRRKFRTSMDHGSMSIRARS